jgi:ATP-binding cassette subfamily B protein
VEVCSAVTVGLILWQGGRMILDDTLLPGVMVAFIQYVHRMFQPIRDLAEKYKLLGPEAFKRFKYVKAMADILGDKD